MEDFLSAIRAACSPNTWSRGVELARKLAITGVSEQDGEIVCRVKAAERTVPFTVRLYVEDEEWDCDCGNRSACCEHAAGAAIALNKARASGQRLPEGRSQGAKLVHCFTRHRGFLSVERVIRWDESRQKPLRGSLASAVATQSEGVELSPSQQDLAVDRLLGQRPNGPLHAELGVQVVKLLGGSSVELDGATVYVSTDPLRPVANVGETGDGFLVALKPDPRLEEVVAPGVGRAGNNLHLLQSTEAAGETWQQLPSEKVYRGSEVATLVTEVLPELSKHFTLSVNTERLPKLDRNLRPREVVEVEQVGETLSVRANIVYGEPATCRVDGGRLVYLQGDLPVRNEASELRVAERIKARLGLTPGRRLTVSGSEATQLAVRLDRFDGEIIGRKRDSFIRGHVVQPRIGPTTLTTGGDSGVPDFVFQARDSDGTLATASAESVLRAWQNGDPLVPLLEGGWAPLPADWLSRYGTALQQVFAARGQKELPAVVKPALVELYTALETAPPPDLEPLRQLLYDPAALAPPALPEDLTATLRPYQLQGVRWLGVLRRARMGATLADDMGLGKTLQVICNLEGKCLVVAPTSLVFNWADEIARFRPALTVNVYHGKSRSLGDADVTLTSYALLRLDLEQLRAREWDMVVLDEAQAIKNPESQVAQAAYALRGGFRVTVTGTPVENRLEELWSQFQFTNPGLLGSREQFRRRYAETTPADAGQATAALRRTIVPFILRRDKKSVAADLPPRTDVVLHCELDESERTLYDALLQTTRKEVAEQLVGGGNVMKALEALLRLRQAACHRALVPGQVATNSSKVEVLCDALEEVTADGHKALVFSQWTGFLDLVEPHLRERAITFNRLDGSTSDRAGVVRAFQEEPNGPSVMLLSLKAGGVGLNLTAADHVFLLDLWWNPAVEQQAADRAHRIGQQNPVFIHRLVARNTVEEKILKLQESKRAVADAVLSDSHQVAGLSREDLLELLQ